MARKSTRGQSHFSGMEPPVIEELTDAIRRAHDKAKVRIAAQNDENLSRDTVLRLMHEHADDLRCPDSGKLKYTVDGITAVITPGKEKLSVSVNGDDEDDEDDEEEHPDVRAGRDRPVGTPALEITAAEHTRRKSIDETPIAVLPLKAPHMKALREVAGLRLVSQLVVFRNGGQLIGGVTKGLGAKACEEISTRLDEWLEERGIPQGKPADPPAAGGQTVDTRGDWYCCECGHRWQAEAADECPSCEEAFAVERVGFHGDPNVNEHGVYVAMMEPVRIPAGHDDASVWVETTQGADGKWRCGFELRIGRSLGHWRQSELLTVQRPGYVSRRDAIEATVGTMIDLTAKAETDKPGIRDAVLACLKKFSSELRSGGKAKK